MPFHPHSRAHAPIQFSRSGRLGEAVVWKDLRQLGQVISPSCRRVSTCIISHDLVRLRSTSLLACPAPASARAQRGYFMVITFMIIMET
jgi:hypothetical protein